jgi:MFS family permease
MNKADACQLPPPQNFRLMVIGQIVTVFGSSLLRFALSLYVLDITGRADLFAVLLAISSVPVLLAPIGGAISDRWNKKNLMVLYDAICCTVAFGFLLLLIVGHTSLFVTGVVMVTLGIVGAMEMPNGMASIPQLVAEEKLESANGIIQAVQSLSGIIAPVVGGILYGAVGLQFLVTISGAAFALAAAVELFIKIPFVKRACTGGMLRTITLDLKGGFAYVWKDSFIRNLMMIAALLNLVLVPCFIVATPLILRITLNSGDTLYGVGMGIIEAAMILAIALLFVPLASAVTPMTLGMGFLPSFALLLLCLSLMAAATTILSIFVITRIQMKTPGENLGKVMAIIQAAAQCAAPIGQLLYGFLFERFSSAVYVPLLLAGLLTSGIALIGKITLKKEDVIHDANDNNA